MRSEHSGHSTKTSSERYEPSMTVLSVFNALVVVAVAGFFANAVVQTSTASTEVAQKDAQVATDPT
jgi:hypothetical protein